MSTVSGVSTVVNGDPAGQDKIFAAMYKVRNSMAAVGRDAKNTHFNSRYASLEAVMEALNPALAANEILPYQTFTTQETIFKKNVGNSLIDDFRVNVTVRTTLYHIPSGQSVSHEFTGPAVKSDIHGVCGAVTYLRRYSLLSMLCLVTEDDDGNSACANPQKQNGQIRQANENILTERTKIQEPTWRKIEAIIDSHFAGSRIDAMDEINRSRQGKPALRSFCDLKEMEARRFIERAETGRLMLPQEKDDAEVIRNEYNTNLGIVTEFVNSEFGGDMASFLGAVARVKGFRVTRITDLTSEQMASLCLDLYATNWK